MMTKTEIADIRKQAFKEAAQYLEATAADYLQMAERVALPSRDHYSYRPLLTDKVHLADKASLLHGQSLAVGGLK